MKKYIFFLFLNFSAWAQDTPNPHSIELRTNVLAMLSQGNYSVSLEKLSTHNWNYGISVATTQSNTQENNFQNGNKRHLPEWDITPFVRYKLSKSAKSFYFAEGFGAINQGKYKELVRTTDALGNGVYQIKKGTYSDVALGGSLGYKLLIKSSFAVEFLVGFGANLLHNEVSPTVVSRVGLSVGYQF